MTKKKVYLVWWLGFQKPLEYNAEEHGLRLLNDITEDEKVLYGTREMKAFKKELKDSYELMDLEIYECRLTHLEKESKII